MCKGCTGTVISHPWWQGTWGPHRAYLGPTGPRWAPCGPREYCYLGYNPMACNTGPLFTKKKTRRLMVMRISIINLRRFDDCLMFRSHYGTAGMTVELSYWRAKVLLHFSCLLAYFRLKRAIAFSTILIALRRSNFINISKETNIRSATKLFRNVW